jgi:transposase
MNPEVSFAFQEILTTIENWYQEIFNYFDCKVTNAFTESVNGKIKSLQRNGRRLSFQIIRGKIIFRDIPD